MVFGSQRARVYGGPFWNAATSHAPERAGARYKSKYILENKKIWETL